MAGYFLLDQLASNGLIYLRIILGVVIVASSLQLVLPPKEERRETRDSSFVVYGAFSGFMGGLFSTSGPPLVYHFYRQPLPIAAIREMLVAIFAFNALIRLLVVIADDTFPEPRYWPPFSAVVTVAISTHLARRLPPPLSPKVLKLIIFLLLCASGMSLALPAIPKAVELAAISVRAALNQPKSSLSSIRATSRSLSASLISIERYGQRRRVPTGPQLPIAQRSLSSAAFE